MFRSWRTTRGNRCRIYGRPCTLFLWYAWRCLFALVTDSWHPGVIIGVEGNISSGKSTLCLTLQNQVCASTQQPIRVMFEEISSTLLQLFYSDHKRYALTLQLTTLQRRIDNLIHMRRSVADQRTVGLLDRSTMVGAHTSFDTQFRERNTPVFLSLYTLQGDLLFAIKQYLDDSFTKEEAVVYVGEFARGVFARAFFVNKVHPLVSFAFISWTLHASEPFQVLYLHSTPELCHNRVAHRGNVDKDVQVLSVLFFFVWVSSTSIFCSARLPERHSFAAHLWIDLATPQSTGASSIRG